MIFYTADNFTKDMKIKRAKGNHGLSESPTYNTWHAMKQRCTNSKYTYYYNYGGRGIGVCEKWLSFEGFIEDMGERPSGCQLDRVDNSKGYFMDNCEWVNPSKNLSNRRVITSKGLPRGVEKRREIYISSITICKKQYYLGSFKTANEASLAYQAVAFEWYGKRSIDQEIDAMKSGEYFDESLVNE